MRATSSRGRTRQDKEGLGNTFLSEYKFTVADHDHGKSGAVHARKGITIPRIGICMSWQPTDSITSHPKTNFRSRPNE